MKRINLQFFAEGDPTPEVAIKVGETAAKVENLEADTAEVAEKVESAETKIKWTQDDINDLYKRIGELEARLSACEAAQIEETEPGTTEITNEEETIIEEEPTKGEEDKDKEKSETSSKHNFLY